VESFDAIAEALRLAVASLRDAGVPFVLGGSFAAWARGGPKPHNDLDLMVKPDDADRALRALSDAGMRTEKPPEEWLFKVWCGAVMIDLIFQPSGLEITDDVFERAELISVFALETPVMALEDMLATKLHALDEHSLDYSSLLGIARSVREQIDWQQLQLRTQESPYAAAFFTLAHELGIAAPQKRPSELSAGARVRVMPSAAGR
jgi:hypothetical protein